MYTCNVVLWLLEPNWPFFLKIKLRHRFFFKKPAKDTVQEFVRFYNGSTLARRLRSGDVEVFFLVVDDLGGATVLDGGNSNILDFLP